MKGKKISSENYIELALKTLQGISEGIVPDRSNAMSKISEEFSVDTCITYDTGLFETGIESDKFNGGRWIIVEQYENEKQAKRGHKKWIKYMESDPKELTDIFLDEVFSI